MNARFKKWETEFLKDLENATELFPEEKISLIDIEIDRLFGIINENTQIIQEATNNGETLPAFGEDLLDTITLKSLCLQTVIEKRKDFEKIFKNNK